MTTSRRRFLKGAFSSTTLVALAPAVPQFLLNASARAAEKKGETVLVVLQMSGGNDGLNTVIPWADDVYRKSRPSLALPASRVLKIDDRVALHPSMQDFSKLLEAGRLGIVQGVGYPNPDRSHFSSMDIWQTARRDAAPVSGGDTSGSAGYRSTGWIGRYLDRQMAGSLDRAGDVPAMHLGSGAGRLPLALVGEHARVTSVQSLEGFKLDDGGDARLAKAIQSEVDAPRETSDNELVSFLHRGTQSALASSRKVQEAITHYQTDVKYPETALARRLKTVAQLINAGLGTRIYYLDLDGFDTHSNQAGAHASLLSELSGAVSAFVRDLDKQGNGRRTMLMTFSEFGRRLKENASQGTDHGAPAPLFLAGGRVKPGLLGTYPSLTDLDSEGDPKFTTDFRMLYASVLEQWLGVASADVLGASFSPMKLVG